MRIVLTLENEVVLKARDSMYNFYYPAYSPDGDWIVYNRSQNDFPRTDGHFGCYAAPDAEVWLMSRDGSIDIPTGQCQCRWCDPEFLSKMGTITRR